MAEHVKVHLKAGSREIQVEGLREDVDELLAKWWTNSTTDQEEQEEVRDSTIPSSSRSRARRKRPAASTQTGKNGDPAFDSQPIVNAMREHHDHELWEKRVLHAKSAINKIKLVCWYHKQYLTTGEINAVLQGLGVKMSLPNVSNSIKSSLSDFLQDGARSKGAVVRYKLTGKAEKDFEARLNSNE